MKNHIDGVVSNCSSSLFASRTLRFHGLPLEALQLVFKAKILSKLQYCSSAWWGFTTSSDRQRIESFLKRCVKNGYYNSDDLSFAELVLNSDNNLFNSIKSNPHHMLHNLLPPKKDNMGHSLRKRKHDYVLPGRSSALTDRNFVNRTLLNNTTL